MSYMFEVYHRPPFDPEREARLTAAVAPYGGRLTFREGPENLLQGVCLTFEFENIEQAEIAAAILRQQGEHVEGPVTYGTDLDDQLFSSPFPKNQHYVPRAVGLASFLGSPLAGCVLIAQNYKRMSQPQLSRRTSAIGFAVGACVVMSLAIAYRQGWWWYLLGLPFVSGFAMAWVAKRLQGSGLDDNGDSPGGTSRTEKAVWIGIAIALIILASASFVYVVLLSPYRHPCFDFLQGQSVYYAGDATETDAERAGMALQQFGYFQRNEFFDPEPGTDNNVFGGRVYVCIRRDNNRYVLLIQVTYGPWMHDISLLRRIGDSVSQALGNQRVEVHMLDKHLHVKLVVE